MPPTMLISSLESIRRKVRWLSLAFGAGVVAASAVGLVLGVVLLDYCLNLPPIPRVIVLVMAAATLAYAMYRWIVRPMLAKLTLRDVASRLEAAFPQFDDRLRSTVDFVRTPVPGSEFMKTRVVDETSQLASTLNLSGAIVTRPIWYSASAATGAIILLLSLAMLVTPEFRQIALSRILSPFQARAWPKSVEIALLGQTPARLPVGQHLDVRMKLSRGDRASAKAIVYYQYGEMKDGQFVGGPIQQEYMSRGTDGAFGSSLDTRAEAGAAASAMRVWIKSGDDERSLPDVLVVPRLTIRSVIANVTPPAYVSGGDARTQSIDLSKGAAIMPIGAQIKLDVSFSKPLAGTPQDVKFEPMEASMAAPKLMSSTASYGGVSDVWQARQSLRFRIRATDIDGFQNNALEEYEILVRPDQAPTVQIESPRRNEERTAVSSVPIQGLADDDYGIESLKLVVDRLGDKKHWDIPLVEAAQPSSSITWTRAENAGDRLRFRMNYNWILGDLPQADLKPGDVLEYSLLVKDNFALDGETHPPVASGRLRVAIISQEDLTAKVIEDLRQIKARINEVKNAQDRTQVQTRALADDTRNKAQLDAADRQAAERLTNQQATAATQTRQLVTRLDEIQARLAENQADSNELRDLARDVRNDLTRTAENPMKDASAQISAANQPTALQPRPGATETPDNQQEQTPQQGTDAANPQRPDQQASAQDQQPQQPQQPQQGNAARGDQQRPQTSTEARNGSPNGSQQDQQASAQDQQQRDNAGEGSRENRQASAQDQARGDQANQRDQQTSAQQQGRNNAANGGRQDQAGQRDQQASAQQQPRNGAAGDQQPGSQQQATAQQPGGRQGNDQQGARQGGQQPNSQGRQGSQQASARQQPGSRQGGQQQDSQGRQGSQQASAQQQSGSRQGGQQQNSQGRQGSQQASAQQQSGARQGGQQQGSQQQSAQQQGSQQASQQQQGQQQPGSQQQQSPQQQQRNNALAQAQQNQQQASQQLQQALDRMENIGTMQQTIDRVAELLKQQQEVTRATQEIGRQNVGQRPEEMQPQDRQRLNQNADQQRQLAQRTQQAMQNMQRTAEQLQQSDPQSAQAMRQAAQTAQQQQVSSRQQQAADQAQQNQQQQAQGSQRQAEQGLTIMLNQLNEAEKHKLAQLSKQLAQVQEQIDNLIRRQSGHNLDNLSLQGADKLAKLDAAERTDLFNQAGRDEKLPADAQLPALSTAQELTERNARDIGKSIEALPNNAEMAAQLTRAADKMERAIVFLRQSKLPDAYEPPQIDALNALLEAQKHIDDMKDNVDEQIAQNQKEGVRQQYVQILQEQQQLNSETTKIDSTARGADGSLPRAESVRLGQLPGVEGKLSDRISGLEEQLTAAQSIVYVWANQDIAKSMSGVKDDLGNQQTGLPTQTEQKRIAEQLQAMIDNLVERPTRSKFAQDAGNEDQQSQGGQKGQRPQQPPGTRKLPTAAELHLVQSLQKAVNSATKTLADQPEKDKPKLLALGNRQGELRGLLGQLLEKSSDGKVKLGAEPDNRDQLPEEANKEQVEKQELEKQLLTDEQVDEKTEKQVNLVGDRMARVRQRLAQNNDPGKTTQIIEDRIVLDIDSLIEQARQQQMQTRNSRQRQQQQQQRQRQQAQQQRLAQQNQPQNQGPQQNQQQGNTPAANDQLRPGGPTKTDLSATIRESMQEWGGTTPRERAAVAEGADDTRVEPYEKLISDYYKSLATKEIQH